MKKQTISISDKLFIACQMTELIGAPDAVTEDGDAMMFNSEHGGVLINFEEKRVTIDEFTWEEEIMDEFVKFTAKHHLDLVLQLPTGEYSILRYAPKTETI